MERRAMRGPWSPPGGAQAEPGEDPAPLVRRRHRVEARIEERALPPVVVVEQPLVLRLLVEELQDRARLRGRRGERGDEVRAERPELPVLVEEHLRAAS